MSWDKIYGVITAGMSPEQQRTTLLAVLAIGMVVHMAWACGYLPHVSGFALASDMDEVVEVLGRIETTLSADRIDRMESEIRHLHMLRCYSKNGSRQLYTERLNILLVRYRRMTDRQLILPPCSDL